MGGRAATWATALAVAAVVVVAAVDAVRSGGDTPAVRRPATEPALAGRLELVRRLRDAGVGGRLVYTDARCAVQALALPTLRATARPAAPGGACSFSLSPDGRRVSFASAEWSNDARFVAICRGTVVSVYVRREIGRALRAWDGCAPSWRPDGVLTLVRAGELLEVRAGCAGPPPCERVLLGRSAIERAATRHVTAPDVPGLVVPVVDDAAWLSRTRVALLLGVGFRGRLAALGPLDLVAVFEGARLVGTLSGLDDSLVGLRKAKLAGDLVLALPNRLLTRSGDPIGLPSGLGRIVSLALSPDERWLAVATRADIVLVEIPSLLGGSAGATRVHLPLVARDLDWR